MQVVPELVKVGVREIVAVTGAVVELVAMNEEISPDPLAASPIEVVELTQLYTVPGTFPDRITDPVEA